MRQILLKKITLLLLLFLINVSLGVKQYIESEEQFRKRFEFQSKFMDRVSSGKVEVKYTNEQGMFCYAKEDIPAKHVLFRIPVEYIISSCNLLYL